MSSLFTRRHFLRNASITTGLLLVPQFAQTAEPASIAAGELDFPLTDFHVHLDNSTIDKVLELSKERGIKFGIVEHAGTKANQYPVVLSNDTELKRYIEMLDGKPVYKGVQTEWIDWRGCFSVEVLGQLDYILTDAMTMWGKNHERQKLWLEGVEFGDKQSFMDRYVDWHVEIMEKQPIDIFANITWLPTQFLPEYDALWTPARMKKIIDTAVKYSVALEISSSFKVPRLAFLQMAKTAGAKFSLGSNGRYPKMGLLEYSVTLAKELGLKRADMFQPAPAGKKPFQRRGL